MARYSGNTGFTLIEILVALLVTALGVMGLAAAQLNALKFEQTAEQRSHASLLAYDMLDRMRANRAAALSGRYDIHFSNNGPTGDSVYAQDTRNWLASLASQLSAGDGSIARNGRSFTITVQWDESRLAETRTPDADGKHMQRFVFVTEL